MDDLTIALAAVKASSRDWYVRNYAGDNPKTIAYRDPGIDALWYMRVSSWDFAKIAGCSTSSARTRLSKLACSGLISERPRLSGARSWSAQGPDSIKIGYEIIAELRAEGLPFDDEWRAAGMPSTWPPPEQIKEPGAACNGPRGATPNRPIGTYMNTITNTVTTTKHTLEAHEVVNAVPGPVQVALTDHTRAGGFGALINPSEDAISVEVLPSGGAEITVVNAQQATNASN